MAYAIAWGVFILGVAHLAYGFFVFKKPVAEAVAAGFIGQFGSTAARRTAFWFLIFGPLLMLAGHVGIHAALIGDLALLKILGLYIFATALAGVAAFPKSPFWAALFVAPVLIAIGFGLLPL